jgi:hypothetical protein
MKHYVLHSHPYKFYATVDEEDAGQIVINVGNEKTCVRISVYKEEPFPQLDSLSYNMHCAENMESINAGLLPSAGTAHILRVALKFTYTLFPHLSDIHFLDSSSLECNNDVRVTLSYFYMVKYFNTWYEAKFNAKMLDARRYADYKKFASFMKSEIAEKTYDEFANKYLSSFFNNPRMKIFKRLLEPYFAQARTYHDFFKAVADDNDCIVFQHWLAYFIKKNITVDDFEEAKWYIPRSTIDGYADVEFQEVAHAHLVGGRKRIMRNQVFPFAIATN